jgi:hypothetical protein
VQTLVSGLPCCAVLNPKQRPPKIRLQYISHNNIACVLHLVYGLISRGYARKYLPGENRVSGRHERSTGCVFFSVEFDKLGSIS